MVKRKVGSGNLMSVPPAYGTPASGFTASAYAHPLMHTMIDTLKSRRRISHATPSASRPIKAYMMMHFKGLSKVFVISLDEKISIEYSVGRGVAL